MLNCNLCSHFFMWRSGRRGVDGVFDFQLDCRIASPRFRMVIFYPQASTSSILVAVLLGLWFCGGRRCDNGGSCRCDVMRENAVITLGAFALGVKGARTVAMVLAGGLITLTLKVVIAEGLHVCGCLAASRGT